MGRYSSVWANGFSVWANRAPLPFTKGEGGIGKDITGKECALIACCEEEDLTVLDGVRMPMERTAALNKWKMVGEVLIPGVLNVGDIHKTDGCRQAAELADKI